MPAETGEIQPTGYVYLLGTATALGIPTHRRSGEKKIYSTSFVGHQLDGTKKIGWKPRPTGYTSGAYVLCHYISFICLFLYYRRTRIISLSSSPFEARI